MSITMAVRDMCLYDTDPITGKKEIVRAQLTDLAETLKTLADEAESDECHLLLLDPSRRQVPETDADREFVDALLKLLKESFTTTTWLETADMEYRFLNQANFANPARRLRSDTEAPALIGLETLDEFLEEPGKTHTGFVVLEDPPDGWDDFINGEEPDVSPAMLELFHRCIPLSGIGRAGERSAAVTGKVLFSIREADGTTRIGHCAVSHAGRVHMLSNPNRMDLGRADEAGASDWPTTFGIIPCNEDPYIGELYLEGSMLPENISTDRSLLADVLQNTCRERGLPAPVAAEVADSFLNNRALNLEVIYEAS